MYNKSFYIVSYNILHIILYYNELYYNIVYYIEFCILLYCDSTYIIFYYILSDHSILKLYYNIMQMKCNLKVQTAHFVIKNQ